MTELYAITYSDLAQAVRHKRNAAQRAGSLGRRLNYQKEFGRGISMTVLSDAPVDGCVYDSAEFSLICRADLLDDTTAPADRAASPATRIARLYRRHGDSFVKQLRGTFAIILYDYNLRVLKAWTDHFGAARLVYTNSNGFFSVSTDLRLILPLFAEKPALDPVAVQQYLQYTCIPGPKTIYKGISRLAPGHQLTSRPMSVTPYWDMTFTEPAARRTETAWTGLTEKAIRSAVAQHTTGVESTQLGCFLSGGTDSSSVSGLVGQATNRPPNTFSIGFDDPRYNEIQYARIAAGHFKANHHEYFVTPDDILALIEKAVPAYDEPFGNSSIVPTYYCARLAAENGVTHLLAGDGGDELFGGNARYIEDRVFQHYSAIPALLRQFMIEPAVRAGGATRLRLFDLAGRYIRRANINVPDRFLSYSLLSSEPHTDLFTPDFLAKIAGHDPLTPSRNHFAAAPAQSDLNRWLYLDLKMTITDNDIRKVTVMSQLGGVTPRFPLLDPGLAEFTGTLPAELKVKGSQLRYLFKKAMAGVLPPQIITKSKHGFGLPYCVWLRDHGPLRDFTFDILGSARCRQRGYFRRDIFDWLWTNYETVHQTYYGDLLWVFLMLELWHLKQNDVSAAPPPEMTPLVQVN